MNWLRFVYLLFLLLPSARADDVRAVSGVQPLNTALAGVDSCRPTEDNPSLGRGPALLDETLPALRQQQPKRVRAENGPSPGEPGSPAPSLFHTTPLSGRPTEVKPAAWPCPDLLYVLMSLQR
jgi:hypothetical protein